jgi:hypothetical protein
MRDPIPDARERGACLALGGSGGGCGGEQGEEEHGGYRHGRFLVAWDRRL